MVTGRSVTVIPLPARKCLIQLAIKPTDAVVSAAGECPGIQMINIFPNGLSLPDRRTDEEACSELAAHYGVRSRSPRDRPGWSGRFLHPDTLAGLAVHPFAARCRPRRAAGARGGPG